MIDFDKLFESYVLDWYKTHNDEFDSIEQMENALPEIYDEWAETPCEALGKLEPRKFFNNINEASELIDILIGTSEGESNPCSLLLDKIGEVKECAPYLVDIIKENKNTKLTMLCMNLLEEMQVQQPFDTYVSWLDDTNIDEGLRELAIERMSDYADFVAPKLFELLKTADTQLKTYIADILVNATQNESTYDLLVELFVIGENIPLYAGYLGKFGDERALPILRRAVDSANYLEYLELNNAIERLGGEIKEDKDFSEDIYYKAIKNI